MLNKKKILIAIVGIFLLAAGCGKQSAISRQQDSLSSNKQISQSANQTSTTTPDAKPGGQARLPAPEGAANGGQAQTKQNAKQPDYFPSVKQPADPNQISITQNVEGSNVNNGSVVVEKGLTAMDALEVVHQIEAKNYPGIGKMVLAIDGNKADSNHFWEFFVNGKSSSVGASSYILKAGDVIEWRLSELK